MSTVDIIIPCHRPPNDWEDHVAEQMQVLDQLYPGLLYRIILINDGASTGLYTQGVERLLSTGKFLFIDNPVNRGKGFALRSGVSHSVAQYVVYTDFDFPFGMVCIGEALQLLSSGADVVAGKRGEAYNSRLSGMRKLASGFLIFINRHLLRLHAVEAQAGFKAFNERGRAVFMQTTIHQFLFDTEFIYLAGKNKLNIAEVPLQLKEEVKFSDFSFKVFATEFFNLFRIIFH